MAHIDIPRVLGGPALWPSLECIAAGNRCEQCVATVIAIQLPEHVVSSPQYFGSQDMAQQKQQTSLPNVSMLKNLEQADMDTADDQHLQGLFSALSKSMNEVSAAMSQHAIVKKSERASIVAVAENAVIAAYNLGHTVAAGGQTKSSMDALKSAVSGWAVYKRSGVVGRVCAVGIHKCS